MSVKLGNDDSMRTGDWDTDEPSVHCLYQLVSVLKGLILEKIYELSVGTNETVRCIRMSTVLVNANEAFITRPKVIQNCTIHSSFS